MRTEPAYLHENSQNFYRKQQQHKRKWRDKAWAGITSTYYIYILSHAYPRPSHLLVCIKLSDNEKWSETRYLSLGWFLWRYLFYYKGPLIVLFGTQEPLELMHGQYAVIHMCSKDVAWAVRAYLIDDAGLNVPTLANVLTVHLPHHTIDVSRDPDLYIGCKFPEKLMNGTILFDVLTKFKELSGETSNQTRRPLIIQLSGFSAWPC